MPVIKNECDKNFAVTYLDDKYDIAHADKYEELCAVFSSIEEVRKYMKNSNKKTGRFRVKLISEHGNKLIISRTVSSINLNDEYDNYANS